MTTLAIPAGYKHCRALGCSHNAKANTRLSFFRFPKDERRCEVWLKNCGLDASNFTAENCYNNMRLCSAHFEDDMFASLHKNRLKKTAVPTIFSHDKPVEKVIFVETPTPKKIKKKSSKKSVLKKYASSKKITPKKSASTKNINPLTCNLSEQVSLVVTPDVYSMTLNNYDDDDSDDEIYNGNGNTNHCNYRPMYDDDIEIVEEDEEDDEEEEEEYASQVPKIEFCDIESEEEKYADKIPKDEISDIEIDEPKYSHVIPKIECNDEIEVEAKYSCKIPKFEISATNYQNVRSNNVSQKYPQRIQKRVQNFSNYQNVYGNSSENGVNKIPKMEVNTSHFQNMYNAEAEVDGRHRFIMSGSSTSQNYHLTNALLNRVNGEQQYNSEIRPRVTIDDFMDFCDSYFNKKLAAFIKSQIQLQELQGNLHKGVHYDETFKELALSIYTLDPKVYKLLSKTFHLPSKSTLMRTKHC